MATFSESVPLQLSNDAKCCSDYRFKEYLMATAAHDLSIGRLSKSTGCNIETIRYYEKVGLLPATPRTEGGHRVYGIHHAKRLGFVRRSRELGFSLGEVRTLLSLADGGGYDCGKVRELTLEHLGSVKNKIKDLRKLEQTLTKISNACEGGSAPACPIIEALFGGRRQF
jgi:MerR family mercuric resistance operon transcriptional regulator